MTPSPGTERDRLRILLIESAVDEVASLQKQFPLDIRRVTARAGFASEVRDFDPHLVLVMHDPPMTAAREALATLQHDDRPLPLILVAAQQANPMAVVNLSGQAFVTGPPPSETTRAALYQSEQELLHAMDALQRSNSALQAARLNAIRAHNGEAVGQLASGVAHEVKNLLTALLLGIQYLRKHIDNDAFEMRDTLVDMEDAVGRANSFVRGLHAFAPEVLTRERTDINTIIECALRLVTDECVRRHVSLAADLSPSLPTLQLDRSKIEQVLVNLLLNSAHAIQSDGNITVRTTRTSAIARGAAGSSKDGSDFVREAVVVVVEDSGPGIPADKLPHAFDYFFTTSPSSKGTGLGLRVVKNILELHTARIDLANRREGGMRATITFKTEDAP